MRGPCHGTGPGGTLQLTPATSKRQSNAYRRRGLAIVHVAAASAMLIGFAALTIDVGHLYNVRAELQRTADSACLAAAQELSNFANGDPLEAARDAAQEFADRNEVLGEGVALDADADVVFGRSEWNEATGSYSFAETTAFPNAVRVRVRRTANSPNGAVPLFFAHIFGYSQKDMYAEATAVLIPRDIAVVADLSASHTDDSELRHCNSTAINMHAVWSALPGGLTEGDPGYSVQTSGPTWGMMDHFGDVTVDCAHGYDPANDDGLRYMPYKGDFNDAEVNAMLAAKGYTQAEINAINDNYADNSYSTNWYNRLAVALGLAEWNSGMPGGRWQQVGAAPGNGNNTLGNGELEWVESYPGAIGSWANYFDYVRSSSSYMKTEGHSGFRNRYGVKTLINYILEKRATHAESPDLAGTPEQPMQAVKDAVQYLVNRVIELDNADQMSLEGYATYGTHEIDLTDNVVVVSDRLSSMQAAHYSTNTCMGCGVQEAIDELTSARARPAAAKTIILLTDGIANTIQGGSWVSEEVANEYVRDKVTEAVGLGMHVYVVSVGAEPNLAFLQEMAELGKGEHFHAEGSIDEYSAQLDEILTDLGGRRPVVLIE